ncbi:helix-turn-helix transcriptional regulator [Senegalia massiliensis]|uniref:helix-turn-helix transcriptional regulator n=1 Tax=Senegalia massiliensis TaxID=1720316 RepID=UPI00103171CA|nr:helix-turn-helix transcriptional regulator [Senegalia massiliensis]
MYENLRAIRNARNISAIDMAEVLGLQTKAAYYKKESGNVRFSLEEANKISKFLDMAIEDIFFDDEVAETETNHTA